MRHICTRACAAALAAALALSLAACGGSGVNTEVATQYVQGILDRNYLGQYDADFLELIDCSEKEAEEDYLDGLEVEANYFAGVFGIDFMEGDVLDEAVDLYRQVYARSRFTVDPAAKIDDATYGVKVTVEPIDVFHLVADELTPDTPASSLVQAFDAAYSDVDVNAMTDEEYQAYDAAWARMIIGLTLEKLPESGYLEAESKVVQVVRDEEDLWSIPQSDYDDLDGRIIDYNF